MSTNRTVAVLLAMLLCASTRADWVILKDGRSYRGIDYRKHGKGYLFTVESGKTAFIQAKHVAEYRKSPPGEKVEFRGEQVTLREKILALKRERKVLQRKLARAFRDWARGGMKADEGRATVLAQPEQEQELLFGRTLAKHSSTATRKLAAVQLAHFKTSHAVKALAISAVMDRHSTVRATCLQALQSLKNPRTGEQFVPFLFSRDQRYRVRASEALRTFPTYRAIPALMVTITKHWNGGQRSYFFHGAQRAYIGDYELVSGGTTFTLTEVADPIVKFAETGVVLDATIAHSEEQVHVTTLQTITGQRFGFDPEAWRTWWEKTGKALAQKQREEQQAPEPAAQPTPEKAGT